MKTKLAIAFLALWPMLGFAQETTTTQTEDGTTVQTTGTDTAASDESKRDRSYLTGLIEDKLSGEGRTIRLDGFKGALSSRATFDSLTISDDQGPWLVIRNAGLSWNRSAILRGNIDIKELSASSIELTRLPAAQEGVEVPDAEAKPFSLPELPLSLNVDKLDVGEVKLGESILGEPLTFKVNGSLKLAGGSGDAKLTIDRTDQVQGQFSLNGSYANDTQTLSLDLLTQEGQGGLVSKKLGLPGAPAVTLAVSGDGPLSDFLADMALSTDGQQRLTGKVILGQTKGEDGTDKTFKATLAGDITPMLEPAYHDFFGKNIALEVDGVSKAKGGTDINRLSLDAQAVDVKGSMSLAASGLPERFDLDMNVGLETGEPVVLPVTGADTTLQDASLKLSYDAAAGDNWTLTGLVDALKSPTLSLEKVNLDGTGTITQDPDQPAVAGHVSFDTQGIAMGEAALAEAVGPTLTGQTDFNWVKGSPIKLSGLQVAGRDYALQGDVAFEDPTGGLTITTDAQVRHDNLARLAQVSGRDLSGSVLGTVKGSFTVLSGAFDADVDVTGQDIAIGQPQADAALAGQSKIVLSAKRDENGLVLRNFSADAKALSAKASGALATGNADVTATAKANLNVLGAGYGGAVDLNAHYTEGEEGRRVVLNATGNGVAVGQPQVNKFLQGKTVIDLNALEKDGDISLDTFNISNPNLKATGAGALKGGQGEINVSLESDLSGLGAPYRGKITAQAAVSDGTAGRLITLKANAKNVAMGQSQADKLLAGDSVLDLAVLQNGDDIELQKFTLSNPQLSADAKGTVTAGARKIDLNARLANAALLAPGFPGPLTVKGDVTDNGQHYGVNISATGPGNTNATVSGTLASDFKTANLAVKGATQSALANAFISPRSVEGPLNFDLALNGPLALNAVSGKVTGQGLRFSAPTLSLALEAINVNAQLGGGRVNLTTSANFSDGGTVKVTGPIRLTAPYSSDLAIALDRARLRDPNLYDTRISGDLGINGALTGGAKIAGKLRLSDTEIRVPSTGLGGVESIPDITHVAESAASRQTRARAGVLQSESESTSGGSSVAFPLDITISAPNQLFVRGRGLDAELGGQLRITGTTADVVPIGSFELVRGRLDVLNQRFTLDQGSIQLQGEFTPYIDFSATTTKNDYAITLGISGQATAPDLSVTSSPELPQEEVLAQLLFGQGLSNISALQAAELASAVATLAGRNDNGIMSKLRNSTGLDDLDVGTDSDGNATVTAGKYISDKIYTDVELGSSGQTEINLNLDLTKTITAKGTVGSDGDSGLGVFLEKDY
ncbi:translocation/assembly module TamB domain-containing protein [Thioclava litoralis]|uniref:Translocation/assembly module TamB domain-containing protein n=1 Tax=Thioclava litoralis TaxID=3076557 RepID=A0ABZ1DWH1_9RHOB|nr:translocation/assembly module TamB domain-containing protein [Thioclava sp. FTW29]